MDSSKDLSNITMFSSHRYLLRRPAKYQVVPVAYVSQTSGSVLPPNGCAACSPKTRPKIGPPKEILRADSKPDLLPYETRNILGRSQLQSFRALSQRKFLHESFLASRSVPSGWFLRALSPKSLSRPFEIPPRRLRVNLSLPKSECDVVIRKSGF